MLDVVTFALTQAGGWVAAASPTIVAVALLSFTLAEIAAAREVSRVSGLGTGRIGLVTAHAAERRGERRWGRPRRTRAEYLTQVC